MFSGEISHYEKNILQNSSNFKLYDVEYRTMEKTKSLSLSTKKAILNLTYQRVSDT